MTHPTLQKIVVFETLQKARAWAYRQSFDEMMFLIRNKEDNNYELINEERLMFLQDFWDLDMQIIETWE